MTGKDTVIYTDEMRVLPHTTYDVFEVVGGTPICVASFSNKKRAVEYAKAIAKEKDKSFREEDEA